MLIFVVVCLTLMSVFGSFSRYKGRFCKETIYKSARLLEGDIILVLLAQQERVLFQTRVRNWKRGVQRREGDPQSFASE